MKIDFPFSLKAHENPDATYRRRDGFPKAHRAKPPEHISINAHLCQPAKRARQGGIVRSIQSVISRHNCYIERNEHRLLQIYLLIRHYASLLNAKFCRSWILNHKCKLNTSGISSIIFTFKLAYRQQCLFIYAFRSEMVSLS